MKWCNRCGVEKPLVEFSPRGGAGRPRSCCKPCNSLSTKEWARKHPEQYQAAYQAQIAKRSASPELRAKHAASVRRFREQNPERWADHQERSRLKRVYGETREQLQTRLAEQDGRCKICDKPLAWDRGKHIDHVDTDTGPLVRGVLCQNCNAGLGQFKDDPEIMRRAAAYVELYQDVPREATA